MDPSRIDQVREFFVITDLKVAVRMVVEPPFQVPKGAVDVSCRLDPSITN
jgi:hypothetical protein